VAAARAPHGRHFATHRPMVLRGRSRFRVTPRCPRAHSIVAGISGWSSGEPGVRCPEPCDRCLRSGISGWSSEQPGVRRLSFGIPGDPHTRARSWTRASNGAGKGPGHRLVAAARAPHGRHCATHRPMVLRGRSRFHANPRCPGTFLHGCHPRVVIWIPGLVAASGG